METIQAVEQRRSVKHFDTTHKMTDEEVNRLFELAILSPTSFNIQNWRFVAVRDQETKDKIKAAAWGQDQVSDAALLVLVCADLNAHAQSPERYWQNAPQQVQEMLVPMIGKFYNDNEQLQRDEALRSVGIASQTLMLLAKDMGLDSCPMIGFDPAQVGEIINLPDNHLIGMMITIGKAAQPARERGGQLPLSDVLVHDKF